MDDDTRPIRLLWQSSTPLEALPAYRQAIEAHAQKVLDPGTQLQIHGVDRGVSELHFRAVDFLNNVEVMKSVLQARDTGIDGVALGCFVDPILDELREVLDVPVLGMAETAMHVACLTGRRFGILSRTPEFAPKFHRELVTKYGLSNRCAGVFPFDVEFKSLIAGLDGNADEALAVLGRAGARAAAEGAEVLLIGCGVLNLVAKRHQCLEIAGARVLDTTGVLMKVTETMIKLRRSTGLSVSRAGIYAKPASDVLARALAVYGGGAPPRAGA